MTNTWFYFFQKNRSPIDCHKLTIEGYYWTNPPFLILQSIANLLGSQSPTTREGPVHRRNSAFLEWFLRRGQLENELVIHYKNWDLWWDIAKRCQKHVVFEYVFFSPVVDQKKIIAIGYTSAIPQVINPLKSNIHITGAVTVPRHKITDTMLSHCCPMIAMWVDP